MAKVTHKINVPHAAVIVWNYKDRIDGRASNHNDQGVDQTIISTVSCVSIGTSKTKSNPQGGFKLELAPSRNWVSVLTPGSWCAILMSNKPITQEDLQRAHADKVKMIGKIDTVRVISQANGDGSRSTKYLVSGSDWGHIFNNVLYVDNFLASANDPRNQGNAAAVAMQKILEGKNGVPRSFKTPENLRSLMNIFGESSAFSVLDKETNRLAKSIYTFNIPKEMASYFNFVDRDGKKIKPQSINDILSFFHGKLIGDDKYDMNINHAESAGFIDPYTLQGTHSFWQILLENSNPAMNEMLCDMRWVDSTRLQLAYYNRIKPFVFKDYKNGIKPTSSVRSYFQYVKKHQIDDIDILNVNAGTNWRDKYNFVEIRPNFQDFNTLANWVKTKAQKSDAKAFTREGFRPMIVETRQFPSEGQDTNIMFDKLDEWSTVMTEWYFNTHRMLNGVVTLMGQTEYIAVGDNIVFNADLVNPTANFKSSAVNRKTNSFVMAHVEGVSHSFNVAADGSRTYQTTIEFVRGIFTDKNGIPTDKDAGLIDVDAAGVSGNEHNNRNVLTTSDNSDPDPKKLRGK